MNESEMDIRIETSPAAPGDAVFGTVGPLTVATGILSRLSFDDRGSSRIICSGF